MLCPRGHFIADVWLEVPDEQDEIAMWPRGPHKRHAFNQSRGLVRVLDVTAHGPTCARQHDAPRWKCPNTRCGYAANVGYEALALELAAAALAGQSEYRLTT